MTGRPRPRRPLAWGPWVFFAMFAVVFAANGVLVVFAFGSWTGLETRGAYEKGLAYNDTLAAAREQAALDWQVGITLAPGDDGRVRLEATFRDRSGRPPRLTAVTARLIRPTHSGHDLVLPLAKLENGRYGTETVFPLPGQWDVRVRAEHAGGSYQATRRVVVE
ncbi:MAG: FixH family protein [Rhodospirillales bacterium]|nr:FixH family protein [Rhodospirillales bacterium]MDH3910586.1 FixH family protein [Rhodospirillales bacterium]MDH3967379.1 FixH family protein [Rhodospirillales bacterium]